MGIRNVYYQLLYLLAVNVFLLRNADFIFRKCGMFDLGIVNKLQQFETSDCRLGYRPFHSYWLRLLRNTTTRRSLRSVAIR